MKYTLFCSICNKPYSVYKCRKDTARFCSYFCYWSFLKTKTGEKSNVWRGGKKIISGYIGVWSPEHPFKGMYGYVYEHRLVMEKYLGRYLTKDEVVHHIDRNKKNNDISNLQLMGKGEHTHYHHFGKKSNLKGVKRSAETVDKIRRKLIISWRKRNSQID